MTKKNDGGSGRVVRLSPLSPGLVLEVTTRASEKLEPRKAVQWFAQHMENRLRANRHKGGWDHMQHSWLLDELLREVDELREALIDSKNVVHEAADVANFAMMIADNCARRNALTETGGDDV